jgi:hypothetical protein
MENMNNVQEQLAALKQQMEQLKHATHVLKAQTHTFARQTRWWRGIACGVIVLALLGIPPQAGKAQSEGEDLAQRVTDLEYKLQYVTGGQNEVVITGANLRIVNGLGLTKTTNGLGNLIVGYNESRIGGDNRTGSHNVVVGRLNNFSSFGGLVVVEINEISGEFASISAGSQNTASGDHSSVSGGAANTASGGGSSVSGGAQNTASDGFSSVSGGNINTASGFSASVSGGTQNTASSDASSVSGGENNTASGPFSSVSGGSNRSAPDFENWAAGPLFANSLPDTF